MSQPHNDGGPAFPSVLYHQEPAQNWATHGMSLRDWFAGQAAAGLLAHPSCGKVGPGYEKTTMFVAREAFAVADAMLEARK